MQLKYETLRLTKVQVVTRYKYRNDFSSCLFFCYVVAYGYLRNTDSHRDQTRFTYFKDFLIKVTRNENKFYKKKK